MLANQAVNFNLKLQLTRIKIPLKWVNTRAPKSSQFIHIIQIVLQTPMKTIFKHFKLSNNLEFKLLFWISQPITQLTNSTKTVTNSYLLLLALIKLKGPLRCREV